MDIYYISDVIFSDCDLPLVKSLVEKGNNVKYIIIARNEQRGGGLRFPFPPEKPSSKKNHLSRKKSLKTLKINTSSMQLCHILVSCNRIDFFFHRLYFFAFPASAQRQAHHQCQNKRYYLFHFHPSFCNYKL